MPVEIREILLQARVSDDDAKGAPQGKREAGAAFGPPGPGVFEELRAFLQDDVRRMIDEALDRRDRR